MHTTSQNPVRLHRLTRRNPLPGLLMFACLWSFSMLAAAACDKPADCVPDTDELAGIEIPLGIDDEPEQATPDSADDTDALTGSDDAGDTSSVDSYLPPKRVRQGTRTLVCVAIKWPNIDRPAATADQCRNLTVTIGRYYKKNSGGRLTLVSAGGYLHDASVKSSSANLRKVENEIKRLYKADYYIIPSIITYPHANSRIAHVKSVSFMTAAHEVGHLLGLAHAGTLMTDANGVPVINNGKLQLRAYGDTGSIMGRVYSGYLTPPQYYRQGWLPPEQLTVYNQATPYYDLRRLDAIGKPGVSTVIIPATEKGDSSIFISVSRVSGKDLVSVHLSRGGDSRRLARFGGDEYFDASLTGVRIRVLERRSSYVRLMIDREPVEPIAKY